MTELPIQHERASRYDSVVAFLRDRSLSEWIGPVLVFGMAVPAGFVAGHVIDPEINKSPAPGMTISTQHVSHGRRLDANR